MCFRPPHHKEIKGLGSNGLPLFCWVGVHIGVHGVHVSAHQGLEFIPAHRTVPFKTLIVLWAVAAMILK